MKYVSFLSAFLVAGPAFAHDAVHVIAHGAEWVPVFLGLATLTAAGATALATSLHAKAKARARK
ncbi:MAG: hypothetical protein ABJJ53_14420 [Sulfitobacter sp.]